MSYLGEAYSQLRYKYTTGVMPTHVYIKSARLAHYYVICFTVTLWVLGSHLQLWGWLMVMLQVWGSLTLHYECSAHWHELKLKFTHRYTRGVRLTSALRVWLKCGSLTITLQVWGLLTLELTLCRLTATHGYDANSFLHYEYELTHSYAMGVSLTITQWV